jgi:hypothetical protein
MGMGLSEEPERTKYKEHMDLSPCHGLNLTSTFGLLVSMDELGHQHRCLG